MIETDEIPFRSNINPEKMVREITRYGIPRWASHPLEFKNWAKECYAREKEQSDQQVRGYQMEEQDTLSDEKCRMINPISTREFIQKLRNNGVKCFTYQIPPDAKTPPTMLNTVGLWCEVPTERAIGHIYQGHRHQYMTWLQIPAMFEWSVIRLDAHNLPAGEKYRGWRTVLARLIMRKVLTEKKAERIFGIPSGATSKIYRKTLYDFRNGRIKLNDGPTEINA